MDMIRKAIARDGEGLEFVLSDATVDRYGDIVEPDGWVLDNFRENPIALFGHSGSFPIGKWENIRVEKGRLVARLKLAARGTSARIDELIGLVEQGILRAVSVGFRPLKSEPMDPKKPYGAQRYKAQELLETSLVSVPANPAALALARSLNLSSETMSLVFGEPAGTRRRDVRNPGETAVNHAATTTGPAANHPPKQREPKMATLAERIEHAQNELVAKKDKLADLTAETEFDADAVDELTKQIDADEKRLAVLKAAEEKIGLAARPAGSEQPAPAILRAPLGSPPNGFDLLVKATVVQGLAHFGRKSVEQVLDERYKGNQALAVVTKADQTIGTTGVSGWAAELVQTVNQGFLNALTGVSVYPALRSGGIGLLFDGVGTIKLPRRTADTAGGSFVAEGSPIRVGKLTTAAAELSPKKMGVIVAFSKELTKRATPAIEAIVRQAILEDTAKTLDAALLDATASSSARPAGLLNGVSATASGYGGGDHVAVKEDFKALLAPFISANAANGITVVMNPAQALAISMMDGPDNNNGWFSSIASRVNIVESTHATAARLIAIRNPDFATAMGDMPEFDISEQATIHMEDTTPLEIVSGTGPTTADPVRSLWQTNSVGVRMVMDVSWTMARTGMVQWIDGTSY